MNNPFFIGDLVECIDDHYAYGTPHEDCPLMKGAKYRVTEIEDFLHTCNCCGHNFHIRVASNNHGPNWFCNHRFKKVEE